MDEGLERAELEDLTKLFFLGCSCFRLLLPSFDPGGGGGDVILLLVEELNCCCELLGVLFLEEAKLDIRRIKALPF